MHLQRPSNRNPSTMHEKLSFELLVRDVQDIPKQYRILLFALVVPFHSGMEGKSLLLKTLCISDTNPRDP